MRAAAADNPRRKRRGQGLAVRRPRALASIERRLDLDRQVLNGDLLIALEARACRRLEHQRFRPGNRKFGRAGPAPPLRRLFLVALRPRSGRSVAFSIPDGLYGGRGGKPLSRLISSFSVWISAR